MRGSGDTATFSRASSAELPAFSPLSPFFEGEQDQEKKEREEITHFSSFSFSLLLVESVEICFCAFLLT